ncbi:MULTISPECIES: hypothetical protein [Actinomadura]|uniref:Secreted protein n=1 Tax=Actinomadura yumaensis TaxID=111807 RepID=A0ABW2CGE6_9ACTN|nr:hypothetical protein [Actinomadura sp. J1-007]MWK34397.1 hypothetical protein [Actinomadura sp. J1-007]
MAISWTGVGDAVRGTVLDSPTLAAGGPVVSGRPPTAPPSAADSGPPQPRTSPSSKTPAGRRTSAPPPSRRPTPEQTRNGAAPDEKLRSYTVKSGRVVLAVGARSARLVSATPNSGFQVRQWKKPSWIRVDLTDGTHGSAVFATWNDHAPLVEVYEY